MGRIRTIYYEKSKFAKSSKSLAQEILKSVVSNTKAAARGVQPGDFHVIRENTTMPAVLVEGGFFSNAEEAKKLSSPKYCNSLAFAIAKGIDDYMHLDGGSLIRHEIDDENPTPVLLFTSLRYELSMVLSSSLKSKVCFRFNMKN